MYFTLHQLSVYAIGRENEKHSNYSKYIPYSVKRLRVFLGMFVNR